MPFFIPGELVDLEYFNTKNDSEINPGRAQALAEYADSIDFAFFVVNYGYSRADYEELTPRDKLFIQKAHENKVVEESQHMRNAVLNAVGNALRKKNARFIELWKKAQKPVDREIAKKNLSTIQEVEAEEGKTWVDFIYRGNNMRPPQRKEGSDG